MRPTDGYMAALLNVVGVVLLGVSWYAVSGKGTLDAQTPYLNLAVGAVILTALADGMYIIGARRAINERAAAIDALLHEAFPGIGAPR